MQCIALYRSGDWNQLIKRVAEKNADGDNVLHIICSNGDLKGLKMLVSLDQETVENALKQLNNEGKSPVDMAKKNKELMNYIINELDVEVDEENSGIGNLLETLGRVIQEETKKIQGTQDFQPRQDNEFVRKLANHVSKSRQQGGSKVNSEEKSQEEYDMWRNPLLSPVQSSTSYRGGATREDDSESDWDDMFRTEGMEGGKGCGSLPYDLTETSRFNVHRNLASDLIAMSGGYLGLDEDEDVMFGGAAKKSKKDEEDPKLTPDDDNYDEDEDMLGGESEEYSDLLKRTLASSDFERLTNMPSSFELSRPRNEQADIAYKSFIPKLMEYLGLDEETARFYRTAIKVHLLQANPELRKNEDLKIKEMEKMFASARALKAAVKKIDFEEIKKFMEMRRQEGEKRRAERQENKKKLRKERVGKKPASSKTQPSRVRSNYVLSEDIYSEKSERS
jgi:hypothetical protein